MKQIVLLLLLSSLAFGKKLNVVTSIPDIADMVRQIGGDQVKVTSLATGREDLHSVPLRPSFLPLLNRADLLITLGLDAEHAWLPALAEQARNPSITEGQTGWISLNEGITVLNVPEKLSRTEGEQHPDGNPHFNIGPMAGVTMAENICRALSEKNGEQSHLYHENCALYLAKLNALTDSLMERGAPLKGKKIIAYHADLAYICAFYGMEQVETIEPKPGIAPTAGHIKKVETIGKSSGVDLIIHNQSQSGKLPAKIGSSIDAPVVKIANAVGADKSISNWIELQEYNLNQLLEALNE